MGLLRGQGRGRGRGGRHRVVGAVLRAGGTVAGPAHWLDGLVDGLLCGGGGGGPSGFGSDGRLDIGWCSGGGSRDGKHNSSRPKTCGGGVAAMSVMKSVTAARGGLLVVRAAETLLEAVAVHLVLEVAHLLVDLVQDGGLVSVHLGARHRAAHARLRDLLGEEVEELVQVNVLRVVGDEGLVRPDLRVDPVCQLGQLAQLLLRVAATNIIE